MTAETYGRRWINDPFDVVVLGGGNARFAPQSPAPAAGCRTIVIEGAPPSIAAATPATPATCGSRMTVAR